MSDWIRNSTWSYELINLATGAEIICLPSESDTRWEIEQRVDRSIRVLGFYDTEYEARLAFEGLAYSLGAKSLEDMVLHMKIAGDDE